MFYYQLLYIKTLEKNPQLFLNQTLFIIYLPLEDSWEAMEKFTGVRLKLIPDIEKEQLVESMIRGGNFIIFKGYAGANKKVLKLRGPNKPTFYSIYLNANNLYGHSI